MTIVIKCHNGFSLEQTLCTVWNRLFVSNNNNKSHFYMAQTLPSSMHSSVHYSKLLIPLRVATFLQPIPGSWGHDVIKDHHSTYYERLYFLGLLHHLGCASGGQYDSAHRFQCCSVTKGICAVLALSFIFTLSFTSSVQGPDTTRRATLSFSCFELPNFSPAIKALATRPHAHFYRAVIPANPHQKHPFVCSSSPTQIPPPVHTLPWH